MELKVWLVRSRVGSGTAEGSRIRCLWCVKSTQGKERQGSVLGFHRFRESL